MASVRSDGKILEKPQQRKAIQRKERQHKDKEHLQDIGKGQRESGFAEMTEEEREETKASKPQELLSKEDLFRILRLELSGAKTIDDITGIAVGCQAAIDSYPVTYFTLLFSSACDRCHGGTQLSVSSKVGGLDNGHPLSSEGFCYGVAPSFSWSFSRSPTGVLGVVCPEGRLVYRHTCDVSEPLDLLFDVL